jgi:translation initiation factor IF-2
MSPETKTIKKPPVVVILGHVDHGKSSILEKIKDLKITEKESGGITQHIGAYEIILPADKGKEDQAKITFIDTPGHEAFSAMRARGTKTADVIILVVAADEGVKTQTKEAIQLVKKSKLPLIVAFNKIDKPNAQAEKVKRELAKYDILVESLGGSVPSVELSAKTGQGIESLLELILLVADMEDLKADLSQPAEGTVIESFLDSQKGPIATIILAQGVLKEQDVIATDTTWGKIRMIKDFQGNSLKEALPGQPVSILGFEKTPRVGDKFSFYSDSFQALGNIEKEKEKEKEEPSVFFVDENKKVLNIILKADVLGSLEAIEAVLKNIPQERVILRILKSDVGDIQESDVKLADSSKAAIFGFRVKTDSNASSLVLQKKIRVRVFEVIYELVQGIREAMESLLSAEKIRKDTGEMEITAVFSKRRKRQTIGGIVREGFIEKGKESEVIRDGEVIGKGKIINIQESRKDVERSKKGNECGLLFESDLKIEKGDLIRLYQETREKGSLD